jgi:hypothetical protein
MHLIRSGAMGPALWIFRQKSRPVFVPGFPPPRRKNAVPRIGALAARFSGVRCEPIVHPPPHGVCAATIGQHKNDLLILLDNWG